MIRYIDNPPMKYPEGFFKASLGERWWVAHTKAHNEKALAHSLLTWGVAYFLPMMERVTVRRGRKVRCLHPLFPGYVFFAGDATAPPRVRMTNRVANILFVDDQDRLVSELTQLENALEAGAVLQPHRYLREGAICRVRSGVFSGVEGMVLSGAGCPKLVLQVHALGQAVALEIDAGMVEPVN
jgi:transcription antitermination factor NusG